MDWKIAKMTVDASVAAYLDGEPAMQYVRRYFYNADDYEEIDSDGTQALCFKSTNHEYVIAFRGTLPSHEMKDVITDIKAWQTNSEIDGDVHYGFKEYLDRIYITLLAWLKKHIVLEQQRKVIVTGHSLGAAAATIMTLRLYKMGYNVCLYTYGSPRVGDKKFREQFTDIECYRFVNNNDIVASIPFSVFGWYTHIGELQYFNYHGEIVKWGFWQRAADQFRGRFKALKKYQLFDGTYDHNILLYREKIIKHL